MASSSPMSTSEHHRLSVRNLKSIASSKQACRCNITNEVKGVGWEDRKGFKAPRAGKGVEPAPLKALRCSWIGPSQVLLYLWRLEKEYIHWAPHPTPGGPTGSVYGQVCGRKCSLPLPTTLNRTGFCVLTRERQRPLSQPTPSWDRLPNGRKWEN